jgi:transposase-like protein
LSLRNLEEMMAERGVEVDHATVHRWALKIVSVLSAVFRRRKRPVGSSWRCDTSTCRYWNISIFLRPTVGHLPSKKLAR